MTLLLRMNALSSVCEKLATGDRVVYEASVDGTSPWVARCPVYTVHTSRIVQTPAVDAAVVGACHPSPKGIVQTGLFCAHLLCVCFLSRIFLICYPENLAELFPHTPLLSDSLSLHSVHSPLSQTPGNDDGAWNKANHCKSLKSIFGMTIE